MFRNKREGLLSSRRRPGPRLPPFRTLQLIAMSYESFQGSCRGRLDLGLRRDGERGYNGIPFTGSEEFEAGRSPLFPALRH